MKHSKNHKILEALIFGSTEPISENDMIDKISDKSILSNLLNDLKKHYSDRGVNLVKTGKKWSFRTAPDLYDKLVIFKQKKRKISRAATEVLSIVAYNQPVTRAEIENIRGVQMGRGTIDILVELGWIKPKGRRNAPGRPVTWVTTDNFLDHFALENINDLPGLEELKSSGFMDKRAAIASITDMANGDFNNSNGSINEDDDETLEDFISQDN